jgi:hypothetical protein
MSASGAGVRARWLVADGYQVRLVDPMPPYVQHASAIAGVNVTYQATLLLGPLCHLAERRDRVTALREAAGVTAPRRPRRRGGDQPYTGLADTLVRGGYLESDVRRITDAEVVTGA